MARIVAGVGVAEARETMSGRGETEKKVESKVTRKVTRLPELVKIAGPVVKGFQRGSKLLGWPTANLEPKGKVDQLAEGVYFGWAKVATDGKVRMAAISVGWNPHFKLEKKTVEAYLVHEFPDDFYGEEMRLMICGHLRAQAAFNSLDALKEAIRGDVEACVATLKTKEYAGLVADAFFTGSAGGGTAGSSAAESGAKSGTNSPGTA